MKNLVAFTIFAACTTGCFSTAYGWQSYQLRRVQRNVAKLKSFEGRLVQDGLLSNGDSVTTDVLYKAPHRFIAKVATPTTWRGTTVSYDGQTLLFHYPSLRFAVRMSNLVIKPEKSRARIAYRYWAGLRDFHYEVKRSSRVADLPTIELRHRPKTKSALNQGGYTQVYDRFSFPLAGRSTFAGGAVYRYRYDSIELNTEIDDSWFDVALPAGTYVAEWDLAGRDLSAEQLDAGFELAWPDNNGLELVRKRIVAAPGVVPAFGALYEREAFFVFVTAMRDLGEVDYGVPVQGGRLILGPEISSYTFSVRGTRYTIVGNVPYEELTTLATQIRAQRPKDAAPAVSAQTR